MFPDGEEENESIATLVPEVVITEADEGAMRARVTDLAKTSAPYLEIRTAEEYEAAGRFLTGVVKPLEREIRDVFEPIEKKQRAVLEAVRDALKETAHQRDRRLDPVRAVEARVKAAIADYSRRAEAARRELAERIRAREAERQRQLAAADQAGNHAAARALEVVPAAAPPAPLPKVDGVSVRKRWDYEVLDLGALRPGFVKPDLGKLRTTVNALGGDAPSAVSRPGGPPAIRVFQVDEVAAKVT